VIWRRREGELVRAGVNVLWEPKAKGVILKTPWTSLYVNWDRHARRLRFGMPFGFNWRAPIGPWRRVAELEQAAAKHELELRALNYALHLANERYDRIRDANAQLRETLTLYRNEASA
jgi:hypothetical protein